MESARIRRLLPEAYRAAATSHDGVAASPALAAILSAMEAMHAPDEDILARADEFVDPMRAPNRFAIMLSSWLDLDRYLDWTSGRKGKGRAHYAAGLGHLRNLTALAAHLMRWRGTRHGLERFLGVATGLSGFKVVENPPDEKGRPRPFHIHVEAPDTARRIADLVRRIVEEERPAYVTYDIAFAEPQKS
jgi:hypothetical protein